MAFLTKSVAKERKTVTSQALEAALEEKLTEVAQMTDSLEAVARDEIAGANGMIADLESRIADIQQRKMVANGRIERAAATRAQFQITPK